ncbi:unnamed protein product, partial [Brassica oleracea var. botrytis]
MTSLAGRKFKQLFLMNVFYTVSVTSGKTICIRSKILGSRQTLVEPGQPTTSLNSSSLYQRLLSTFLLYQLRCTSILPLSLILYIVGLTSKLLLVRTNTTRYCGTLMYLKLMRCVKGFSHLNRTTHQ